MGTFRGQANSTYHFTYLAELVKSNFGIKASWFDCAQGDVSGERREVCLDPILPLGKAGGPSWGLFGARPIPLTILPISQNLSKGRFYECVPLYENWSLVWQMAIFIIKGIG